MKRLCIVLLLCAGTVRAASFCDAPPTNNQSLAGFTLTDYGLGVNTMTLTQGVYTARADANGAAMFDLKSQSSTGLSFLRNGLTSITICAWVKYYTTNTIDLGIYKTPTNAQPAFFQHWNNGVICYQVGVNYVTMTNTSTNWSFMALRYNGGLTATNRIRAYFNSDIKDGATALANISVTTYSFVIGRLTAEDPWRGDFADILVTTASMTDQQIGLLRTNTTPGTYSTNWHVPFASLPDATVYRFGCWTAVTSPVQASRRQGVYLLNQLLEAP